MNPIVKPYQPKLRKMHPSLEPYMTKELEKFLKSRIIFRVRHTHWISKLVLVRKNNGEIRLYVDFQNLNKPSKKYNYLVS